MGYEEFNPNPGWLKKEIKDCLVLPKTPVDVVFVTNERYDNMAMYVNCDLWDSDSYFETRVLEQFVGETIGSVSFKRIDSEMSFFPQNINDLELDG